MNSDEIGGAVRTIYYGLGVLTVIFGPAVGFFTSWARKITGRVKALEVEVNELRHNHAQALASCEAKHGACIVARQEAERVLFEKLDKHDEKLDQIQEKVAEVAGYLRGRGGAKI